MRSSRQPSRYKQAPPTIRARVARVQLDRIRIPTVRPLPPLVVSQEVAEAVLHVRPPLLIEDPNAKGHYVALANARILHWYRQQPRQDPTSRHKIRCLILSGDQATLEKLRDIEDHLIPMLLGEASVRKTRTGRKKLKEAGVARPREMSDRDRLQQGLAKR